MLKLFNRKKKDNKGFTLVELVIVIAILAILVGLLAPQYTKYVEKTRKTADANNMEEMIKVVKVYAADPANELIAGFYTITISDGANSGKTRITYNKDAAPTAIPDAAEGEDANLNGLASEMNNSVPKYTELVTKSKKWNAGSSSSICATVEITADGGTSVTYNYPSDFAAYMTNSGRITTSSKSE